MASGDGALAMTDGGPSGTGLLSLPAELLFDIHLLAVSPSLPIVSRSLFSLFCSTSPHHRAAYLWRHFHLPRLSTPSLSTSLTWDTELRFPCCGFEVLRILRRWEESEGRKVRVRELPRRLFRSLTEDGGDVDPLLFALLKPPYNASPDRKGGYPLSRAVLAKNVSLLRALLDAGADPGVREALPVRVAVGSGDLDLVRMLIEPTFLMPEEHDGYGNRCLSDGEEGWCWSDEEGRRRQLGRAKVRHRPSSPRKKRRFEDRVQATDVMLEAAIKRRFIDIAEYLMTKGATPTIQALKWMEARG